MNARVRVCIQCGAEHGRDSDFCTDLCRQRGTEAARRLVFDSSGPVSPPSCIVCGQPRLRSFSFVCSLECDEVRARRAWDGERRTAPPKYGR